MTKVKEMMVPVSDYTTVSEDGNLFEAIMALEASQEKNDSARYPHRAVLALDSDGNVVGKVNMYSILGALEPKYDQIIGILRFVDLFDHVCELIKACKLTSRNV